MEDKTKKIIAGVGLGVLGMATLTGCTEMGFSVEQTDKIESLVDQSSNYMDSTLGLLEETNVNQQELLEELRKSNSKISAEQAAKLVNTATTKLMINSGDIWSNLKITQKADVHDIEDGHEDGYNSTVNIFKDSEGSYIVYEDYNGVIDRALWSDGLFESPNDIDLPTEDDGDSGVLSASLNIMAEEIYNTVEEIVRQMLMDESVIVNACINEDNNYEIDCFLDSRLIDTSTDGLLVVSLKCLIDKGGRLLSMILEQVQYTDSDSLVFMANVETEFAYGELTEESVYGDLGVTSADKPWKQSN